MSAGVDLSNNNPHFNAWDGVEFAMLKASEGVGFTDGFFLTFRNECEKRGIPWGAYHFAHPDQNSAAVEAQYFLSRPGVYPSTKPPALDFETHGNINPLAIMGAADAARWIDEFNSIVRDTIGHPPYIYTFRSYAKTLLPLISREWPLWLASASGAPNSTRYYGGREVAIEQWGIVDGVDRNESYEDATVPPPTVPTPAPPAHDHPFKEYPVAEFLIADQNAQFLVNTDSGLFAANAGNGYTDVLGLKVFPVEHDHRLALEAACADVRARR